MCNSSSGRLNPAGPVWRGLMLALVAVLLAGCDFILGPELPVQTTYRPSLVGEGVVVQLHNESDSRLVLRAEVRGANSSETKEFTVSMAPNGYDEIGWLQGHAFRSGDRLTLRHDNFRSRSIEIP